MTAKDMWGDFQVEAVRTPVQILKEQASALGPKTKTLVVAEVDSVTEMDRFYHTLDLVVPTLDGYRYNLLRLHHTIEMYPLQLDFFGDSLLGQAVVSSEEELNLALQKALSAQKTKRIINSLLGQVTSIAS